MDFLFPATVTTPLDRFAFLFLLLILYSFLGWCGEMVYCSLAHWRLCEKRGFLNGPLCTSTATAPCWCSWSSGAGAAAPC